MFNKPFKYSHITNKIFPNATGPISRRRLLERLLGWRGKKEIAPVQPSLPSEGEKGSKSENN